MNQIGQTITKEQTPIEIALQIDENGMTTARKLYEFLEMNKTQFSRWAKTNIENNEFYESGTDWVGFDTMSNGNECKDYTLTTDFAKHLCMESHSAKGKIARDYFIKVETKLKEIAKPLTALQMMELQLKALKEVDTKLESVNQDLQDFKKDMPLLALECQKITNAKNKVVVNLMNGHDSNAYKDNSLRGKVYRDLESQLKREFGVDTYKAIKRSQCDLAVEIIRGYKLPLALSEDVKNANMQTSFA